MKWCIALKRVKLCTFLRKCAFMLPCIVIDFLLNNQPDALIIRIYSVLKLYMFRASSVLIIRRFLLYISALVSFMLVSDYRFQAESGWNYQFRPDSAWKRSSETCMKLTSAEMYSRKLLMMGREDSRNMQSFITMNLDNQCVWLVI